MSLKLKSKWRLTDQTVRAFIKTKVISEGDIRNGFILQDNHPYDLVFDDLYEGIRIVENCPVNCIISYQTMQGGFSRAIVRIFNEEKAKRKEEKK